MSGIERSKPSPIRKMRPLATHARLIVDTRNVFECSASGPNTGLGTEIPKTLYFQGDRLVLRERIELSTSPLPMECSTTELPQQVRRPGRVAVAVKRLRAWRRSEAAP